jgi:uncharacterized membrane protein YczE
MRTFIVGVIVGVLLLSLGVFGYVLAGQAPVATDAPPDAIREVPGEESIA